MRCPTVYGSVKSSSLLVERHVGRAASSFRRKELLIGSSNRKDTRRPAKHLGLPNPVVCLRIPGQPGLRVGDTLVPCPIQVEGGNDVDSSQPLSGPRVSAGSGWERNSFGRSQGLLMISEAFCFGWSILFWKRCCKWYQTRFHMFAMFRYIGIFHWPFLDEK